MVDWSLITAVLVVALLGGAITGAASLLIGGLGGARLLDQRMGDLEALGERTNERITREVKQRAGDASVAKRTDADVRGEALALQAKVTPQKTGRPSIARLRAGA